MFNALSDRTSCLPFNGMMARPVSRLMTEQSCWESAAAVLGARRALTDFGDRDREALLEWAINNRLAGLLWQIAGSADAGAGRDGWFDAACRQAAHAVYQERELRRVVDEFARAGISPILLKGGALAYTIYPDASLRPRSDNDVLVAADQAGGVQAVLERLGYERSLQISGDLIMSQLMYRRTDERAIRYQFDVHWKISNALAYADRLSYDEIRAEAVSMPRLDSRALAPSAVHSLAVACVHRIAHHADTDDLLWLYDIHLLARSLTEAEWRRALALAEAKQLCAVLLRGIERAGSAIGQSAPGHVIQRLSELSSREPAAPLLGSPARTIDLVLTDLRALPSSRARLQLLAEHLIPSASYMRRAYPRCPPTLLPLAYAYRIVRGAPKWFRRG